MAKDMDEYYESKLFEAHTCQRLSEIVEINSGIIELKLVLNVFNDCLTKVGNTRK